MNGVHHATNLRSAHMADVKGKGIYYENDDEPIQLTDQDDSPTIHDYRLSLIGKILNPKKQSVEKLIQTMPAQWEMQEKIMANDLGNIKFLLNVATEEDLLSVLRQGPFHYNFSCTCLFDGSQWFTMTTPGSSCFGLRSPVFCYIC